MKPMAVTQGLGDLLAGMEGVGEGSPQGADGFGAVLAQIAVQAANQGAKDEKAGLPEEKPDPDVSVEPQLRAHAVLQNLGVARFVDEPESGPGTGVRNGEASARARGPQSTFDGEADSPEPQVEEWFAQTKNARLPDVENPPPLGPDGASQRTESAFEPLDALVSPEGTLPLGPPGLLPAPAALSPAATEQQVRSHEPAPSLSALRGPARQAGLRESESVRAAEQGAFAAPAESSAPKQVARAPLSFHAAATGEGVRSSGDSGGATQTVLTAKPGQTQPTLAGFEVGGGDVVSRSEFGLPSASRSTAGPEQPVSDPSSAPWSAQALGSSATSAVDMAEGVEPSSPDLNRPEPLSADLSPAAVDFGVPASSGQRDLAEVGATVGSMEAPGSPDATLLAGRAQMEAEASLEGLDGADAAFEPDLEPAIEAEASAARGSTQSAEGEQGSGTRDGQRERGQADPGPGLGIDPQALQAAPFRVAPTGGEAEASPLPQVFSGGDGELSPGDIHMLAHARWLGAGKAGGTQVSLQHPDLGPMSLVVEHQEGRIEVRALMEDQRAAVALRASESALRYGIQQAGMRLGALRVRARSETVTEERPRSLSRRKRSDREV